MVLQWFSKKVLLVGYTYIVSSFYNSFTPPAPPPHPPWLKMVPGWFTIMVLFYCLKVQNGSRMAYFDGSLLLFEGSGSTPSTLASPPTMVHNGSRMVYYTGLLLFQGSGSTPSTLASPPHPWLKLLRDGLL